MAANEHYAIAHDTSVPGLRTQANFVRRSAEPSAIPVATLCDKRSVRHTLEIQVSAADNRAATERMRIHNVRSLDSVIELISNGRDALELNGASPVRVNVSEDDYYHLLTRIANDQNIATDRIKKVWLASVRVEKSSKTADGRIQLVGADGSNLNLNWGGCIAPLETIGLPSTIHPVDFSSSRG